MLVNSDLQPCIVEHKKSPTQHHHIPMLQFQIILDNHNQDRFRYRNYRNYDYDTDSDSTFEGFYYASKAKIIIWNMKPAVNFWTALVSTFDLWKDIIIIPVIMEEVFPWQSILIWQTTTTSWTWKCRWSGMWKVVRRQDNEKKEDSFSDSKCLPQRHERWI